VQNSFFHHPALSDNDPDNDFQKLQLAPDPHLNLVNLTNAAMPLSTVLPFSPLQA
jgi:hypothetical protein